MNVEKIINYDKFELYVIIINIYIYYFIYIYNWLIKNIYIIKIVIKNELGY